MTQLKIDVLKFTGAKAFTSKSGDSYIAIPVAANAIYTGEKGSYLSLTLHDNKDGVDKYGNHGFATVDLGKDRRLAGEKGPILGNFKIVGGAAPPLPADSGWAKFDSDNEGDDIPF